MKAAKVLVYSTRVCPYCRLAEDLLKTKGVAFEKVLVDDNPARREEMWQRAGRTSVPQVFIGETHVGGFAELAGLERSGRLTELLNT